MACKYKLEDAGNRRIAKVTLGEKKRGNYEIELVAKFANF